MPGRVGGRPGSGARAAAVSAARSASGPSPGAVVSRWWRNARRTGPARFCTRSVPSRMRGRKNAVEMNAQASVARSSSASRSGGSGPIAARHRSSARSTTSPGSAHGAPAGRPRHPQVRRVPGHRPNSAHSKSISTYPSGVRTLLSGQASPGVSAAGPPTRSARSSSRAAADGRTPSWGAAGQAPPRPRRGRLPGCPAAASQGGGEGVAAVGAGGLQPAECVGPVAECRHGRRRVGAEQRVGHRRTVAEVGQHQHRRVVGLGQQWDRAGHPAEHPQRGQLPGRPWPGLQRRLEHDRPVAGPRPQHKTAAPTQLLGPGQGDAEGRAGCGQHPIHPVSLPLGPTTSARPRTGARSG